jgi:hypothetical protein
VLSAFLLQPITDFVQPSPRAAVIQLGSWRSGAAYRSNNFIPDVKHQ